MTTADAPLTASAAASTAVTPRAGAAAARARSAVRFGEESRWLVAGEDAALGRAPPVRDAFGSSVLHVGTGVAGSSLKLAVNAWMTAVTVAMSDVLALCDALGIDHATFVTALEAGPLAMPYELQKVSSMDADTYTAGVAVHLALEDINLAAELATPSPLLQVVHDRLERAVPAGHGSDDPTVGLDARRAIIP